MRIRARFNEFNYKANMYACSSKDYFNLKDEHDGKVTDDKQSKLNIIGAVMAISRHEDNCYFAIAREENVVMVPIAMNSEEYADVLKEKFTGKKVRVMKRQQMEYGLYEVSISLVSERIKSTVEGVFEDAGAEDHTLFFRIKDDQQEYELKIPQAAEENLIEYVKVFKDLIGGNIFLDLDENGKVLQFFAAAKLPPEKTEEDLDIGLAYIIFTEYEYEELLA